MATRKETVDDVVARVLAGEDVDAARQRVADNAGRNKADVDLDFKAARYLVVNEHDTKHPLLENPPPDVVVVRYGWTADHEPNRDRLFREMGVGISALPCVIAWEEERAGEDDPDGNPTVIAAGFRTLRVKDMPPTANPWAAFAAPADRKRPVRGWGLLRNPPPVDEEV